MNSPEFILHHYALSPFSQKVRSMLGHAGLPWRSAVTREFPPRPVLAQLAGGYRKVPVAQVGADIFCDSKIIAEEIAARSGQPALSLEAGGAAVQDYVRTVDLEIFLCCIMQARPLALLRNGRSGMSPLDGLRLIVDRIQIGRKSAVDRRRLKAPRQRVLDHLADAERRLQAHDFLFGPAPGHADFSAYHALWFMADRGGSPLVRPYPAVSGWMARMRAFGDGNRQEIDPKETLAVASAAEPRPVPAEAAADPLVGTPVAVAPADYAQEPTRGTLAGVTPWRWIVAREVKGLGTLHVHFPRQGYEITGA
ncbi:glutathione S-transferase family protein [Zavarzinia compransoris]|uniref:Glutathione S-transferase family protein n=1 Tax=Zavarzinia compransoris TaxID=1264899 RepID=A0A317E8S4_9PROT|nr:glutathione S-transferase family protein [Zavarzinia compransoris]PWR23299.1 glutathione S-transferase family protein [Zavarzinia compransoris]TDP46130.1 glutathione S-transferase [Zavarzinia compransoris]